MAAGGCRWSRSRLSDSSRNDFHYRGESSHCYPPSIFDLGHFDDRARCNIADRYESRLFSWPNSPTHDVSWLVDLSKPNPFGSHVYVLSEYGSARIASFHEHQGPNKVLDGFRHHYSGRCGGLLQITGNSSRDSCRVSRGVDRSAVYLWSACSCIRVMRDCVGTPGDRFSRGSLSR
jgi:hypothetical protein